jgi:hypothetical protein
MALIGVEMAFIGVKMAPAEGLVKGAPDELIVDYLHVRELAPAYIEVIVLLYWLPTEDLEWGGRGEDCMPGGLKCHSLVCRG